MHRCYPYTLLLFLLPFWSAGQRLLLQNNTAPKAHLTIVINDTIQTDDGLLIVDASLPLYRQPLLTSPNFLGKAMMTPTAWGNDGEPALFAGIGGTFPQIYSTNPDMIGVVGIAAGSPRKSVGGIVMLNINDVSGAGTFSANLILNRRLSTADAVAVGGIHLLASSRTDAGPSYFVVYSRAVQSIFTTAGRSRLHYSVGAGTGRFYTKSPADRLFHGLDQHGTFVFGNLSFEVKPWMNANLEWSGINLHSSVSVRPRPFLPVLNLGFADILRTSGERIRLIASVQHAVPLSKIYSVVKPARSRL